MGRMIQPKSRRSYTVEQDIQIPADFSLFKTVYQLFLFKMDTIKNQILELSPDDYIKFMSQVHIHVNQSVLY